MVSAIQNMNKTIEESHQVMEKMDELTDNMILARNVAIGSLVAYAGFHILNRWFLTPFMSTFRFLVNQTSAVRDQLKLKYGNCAEVKWPQI